MESKEKEHYKLGEGKWWNLLYFIEKRRMTFTDSGKAIPFHQLSRVWPIYSDV